MNAASDGPDPIGGGARRPPPVVVRRRRRTKRRRRSRVLLLVGAAAVLLLAGGAGAVLLRDALTVRQVLAASEARVDAAQGALTRGEVDAARAELARARGTLTSAQVRTNRLLWRAAERVPVLGRSFTIISAVVDVADRAAELGREAVEQAGGLVGSGGELDLQVIGGRVDLLRLRAAGRAVAEIDTAPLAAAVDRLETTSSSLVPAEVRAGRHRALGLGFDVLGVASRAEALLTVLPAFLGVDEPRRYFLAMQNPAELRGTGGLLGYYALLSVDDGHMQVSEPVHYDALDRDPDVLTAPFSPVPADREFLERYGRANASGFLANVNIDPDLPTVAEVLLDIYEARLGEELDGVITIDPVGLQMLMSVVGPVRLPDEAADPSGRIPNPLPANRIASATTFEAYEVFGGPSDERKRFLREVATSAFDTVFTRSWDAVDLGRQLARAAGRGHVQVYAVRDEEQEAFEHLGVAGRFVADEPGDDLLAVSAVNAAANKMDVHVGHELAVDVRLLGVGPDSRRLASVEVGVVNDLPTSGMDIWVIGSALPLRGFELGHIGPMGLNRTWFTVWAPSDNAVLGAVAPDGARVESWDGVIHGQRATDVVLETPSQSRNAFRVDLSGPAGIRADGPDRLYRLNIGRQAKAIPDRLSVTVTAPAGWSVADVQVFGGGDGQGMGVFGDPGPPLRAEVDADGAAVVTADVTEDLVVEVRLTRSLWSQLVD